MDREATISRTGSGVYSLPAGSTVANGDISDASDINGPLADLEADANVARPIVAGGTGATTKLGAQQALDLEPGVDIQAYDAGLASIAGLTTAADKMIYTTAADTYAVATLTAAARGLMDDATVADMRATLAVGDNFNNSATLITDWNVTASGVHYALGTATNAPGAFLAFGFTSYVDANYAGQIAIRGGGDEIYYRRKGSGTWQSWVRVIDTANLAANLNAAGSAPIYACRAWANFNGTGTIALRASGNVSSLTDGGNGTYTVNLTTALSDTNYAAIATVGTGSGNLAAQAQPSTTSAVSIRTYAVGTGTDTDAAQVQVAIFR